MCAKCDEARGPVAREVVRRTGLGESDVLAVLKAIEDMTIEAEEIMEKREQEARAALTAAALSGDREQAIETIRGLFGGDAEVHITKIGPDGFPAPAPAHPIDRPTGAEPGEPRRGMYL